MLAKKSEQREQQTENQQHRLVHGRKRRHVFSDRVHFSTTNRQCQLLWPRSALSVGRDTHQYAKV